MASVNLSGYYISVTLGGQSLRVTLRIHGECQKTVPSTYFDYFSCPSSEIFTIQKIPELSLFLLTSI